jgi:hypothetical protein
VFELTAEAWNFLNGMWAYKIGHYENTRISSKKRAYV